MSSEAPRMKSEVEQREEDGGIKAAQESPSPPPPRMPRSRHIFSIIPGVGSGGAAASIIRQGKSYRVSDIAALVDAEPTPSRDAARQAAINALAATELPNRSELCMVASALFHAASLRDSACTAAQEGLVQLLSAHLESSEGVHLTLQVLRSWEKSPAYAALCATLTSRLRNQLPPESSLTSRSRLEFLEAAHIFSQALLTETYRAQAHSALIEKLQEQAPTTIAMRRELAAITIAALRKLGATPADLSSLRILATTILARGTASNTTQRPRTLVMQPRNTDLVTAQQAEQRRQFGLAVTIEIIKSLPLLGRPITADEFENALRFDISSRSLLPANRFWPTPSEWHTIERALEYAEQQNSFPPIRIAACAKILATRIKVEDPKDPRESKRRPDVLPAEERLKILAKAERISRDHKISPEDVDLLCVEICSRLLAPEFSQWTAQLSQRLLE